MAQIIPFLRDKLSNVMSGMGTSADKSMYGGYNFIQAAPMQVESAYRTSWIMRKIVDIPAIDMTRAWRAWQADRDLIKLLEAEEKRLQIKAKCKRALILARLWGGGLLMLGTDKGEPEQELDPTKLGKGGLKYVHVFSRYDVTVGQMIGDPTSPWFGMPEYFKIQPRNGAAIHVHPSRVIAFLGQRAPEGSTLQADWFWGDPLYQSVAEALKNADLAQDGFAALINEAKIDVVKIPDMMKNMASSEYETRLLNRLQAAQTGKSTWRMLAIDGAEEWDQKQVTWSGIPDMLVSYLQVVSGAADIPVTRLLGQSPKGLQSTGEGEEKDYHAMVEARQDELLAPALDRLDELLLRSALGSRPEEIWYRFNTLMRISPKDAAEIEAKRAQAVQTYSNTGLIDPEPLGKIARTAITESGQWPGSDEAFEEYDAEAEESPEDDPEAAAELVLPEEREALADRYGKRKRRFMSDEAFEDREPRSLYVSRRVLNADEILAHYAAQGIEDLPPAEDLHITVIYSRAEIDWMEISPDWSSSSDGAAYVIPAGGPREMDLFGPQGDVLVLRFNDEHLHWRHEHMLGKGASSEWGEYKPHLTIKAEGGTRADLDAVEPWQGPIALGPEIFETVKEDLP